MEGGLYHHPDGHHQQLFSKRAPSGSSPPSASSGPSCSTDNATSDTQLMPRGDMESVRSGSLALGSFMSAATLPGLPALRALQHSSSITGGRAQPSQPAAAAAEPPQSPEGIEELLRTVSGARQEIRGMRAHLLAQRRRQHLAQQRQATAQAREASRAASGGLSGAAAPSPAAAAVEQQEPASSSMAPTPRSMATNVTDQLLDLAEAQRSTREAAAAVGGPAGATEALSLRSEPAGEGGLTAPTAAMLHALSASRPAVDHGRLVELMHDLHDAKRQAKACINKVVGLGLLSSRRTPGEGQVAPSTASGQGLGKRPLDTDADAAADHAAALDERPAKMLRAAAADTRDSACSDTTAGAGGEAASAANDEQLGPDAPAAKEAVGPEAAAALQDSMSTVLSLLRLCGGLAAVVAPCADDATTARATAAAMAAQRDHAVARLHDAQTALQFTRQQLTLAKSYVAMKSKSAQRLQQDAQAAAAAHSLQAQRMGGILQRLMEVAGCDSLPLEEKHTLVAIASDLLKAMA